MGVEPKSPIAICLALAYEVARAKNVDDIFRFALAGLGDGLGVSSSAIALFDTEGAFRVKASRGFPDVVLAAFEDSCPWPRRSALPAPLVVSAAAPDTSLAKVRAAMASARIPALVFVPLVEDGLVEGSVIMQAETADQFGPEALQFASLITIGIAFSARRKRNEETIRRNQDRLQFALDAASMGTWDWDLATHTVRWSENLEQLHGLPPGTFDGTFASYEKEIHPDDRELVLASVRRAITEGTPHDVEYRIVAPDGRVQWVEGKGRVEYQDGRPVRMTGICLVVTERKEAELARLASAEEANRLKDEFLATLSHELRTPLNAILGWTQMLQMNVLPAEKVRPAVEVISRNARLQAQLIEDILDVSRIIRGTLDVEQRQLMLAPIIDAVLSGVMPSAEAKRIHLACDLPDALPPILGDPRRLQQVLGNIISNAIKFTPEGGQVSVRCAAAGETISIQVRDSGAGITADLLPFIFDRFRQGDSGSTRTHGGLGLGLAIARHLVERHQGTIRAESAGPGRGTTFHIELPVAPPALVDEDLPRPSAAARLPLSGLTVVVVDDQQDSRELLAAFFDQCDARVVQCDSAGKALEAILSTPLDLLVADIAMPHVDGYDLITRVRGMAGERSAVPAIAVSAYARLEDRTRALMSGYDGYCAKPVDAAELLHAVDVALASKSQDTSGS